MQLGCIISLFVVPAPGSLELQDFEPLWRSVVRSVPRGHALKPSAKQPQLFSHQSNLAFEPLGLKSETGASRGPSSTPPSRVAEGHAGQSDDVDQGGLDEVGPIVRQREGWRDARHGRSLGEKDSVGVKGASTVSFGE